MGDMPWWFFALGIVVLLGLVGFLIFRLMKKPED
jgi:LPXTG-motif cell wall-anchored protein